MQDFAGLGVVAIVHLVAVHSPTARSAPLNVDPLSMTDWMPATRLSRPKRPEYFGTPATGVKISSPSPLSGCRE